MAAPNIVDVTTITGKTAVLAVTTTATAIVTNSSGSGKVLKVNALYATSSNATDVNLTIDLFRSSTAYNIVYALTLATSTTADVLSKSIYLEEGDSLRAVDDVGNVVSIICSYEEIS